MSTEIKQLFLKYHMSRGFDIYESFPLVIDDPTILFTNATVTPFKPMFTGAVTRHNFALVQRCLRLGGSSGTLEDTRCNLNLTSLFEMLGSGIFDVTQEEAVAYFVEVLQALGLSKSDLVFSAPSDYGFKSALLAAGVDEGQVRLFEDECKMKHEWSFGEGDLHGVGVVVWFVPHQMRGVKFQSEIEELRNYIQLGRIVHIDGVSRGDLVEPNGFTAYDLGLGLGRVETALSGDCRQAVQLWRECAGHLRELNSTLSTGDAHYIANLFRISEALLEEGLLPGSKKQASSLRKVLRKLVEEIWLQAGSLVDVVEYLLIPIQSATCPDILRSVIFNEERALRRILSRARKHQLKNPDMTKEQLRSTFGIRFNLLELIGGGG